MGEDRLRSLAEARRIASEAKLNEYAVNRNRPSQVISHPEHPPQDFFPFEKESFAGQVASTNLKVAQAIQRVPIFAGVNTAIIQYGLPFVAVALIGAGVGLAVVSIQNNLAVQDQVQTFAGQAADSGETDTSGSFIASKNPRHPVKIELSSLSIAANTTQVGVNNKGNIGAPASIKELAWYDKSSSPADMTGSSVIVGHVGSPTYAGALSELYKVEKDAQIKVTMGDGAILYYAVTEIKDLPVDDINMASYLPTPNQSTKQLAIITCAGDYNARTHSYDDRLIVTASAL